MSERLTAGDICTRAVAFASRSNDLIVAAGLMREHHVGALVVVDEAPGGVRTVAGILTDRDIVVAVVAPGLDPSMLSVGDVMSLEPITASEDDSLIDLMRTLRDKGVRRIPIVSAQRDLIGLVTLDDVLEVLAQELNLLVGAIGGEQRRERKLRR